MTQFRKLVSGALSLTTAVALSGLGALNAYAAPLTNSFVTLSDSRGSQVSTYVIDFNVVSTTNIKGFKFVFSNKPSGSVVVPTSFDGTSGTLDYVKLQGNPVGTFAGTFTNANGAGGGVITLADAGAGTGAPGTTNTIEISLSTITNNDATDVSGNQCDSVANSETCYVRITTYSDNTLATPLDTSVASYTVISPVTVTATVDPSLTFTVSAVVNTSIVLNDTTTACQNSNTSTATTLPFGNLGVGVSKNRCAQHSLAVATNAVGGYDTTMKFLGTELMTGTISGDNIDVFAGHAASYAVPQLFDIDPTGSVKNVDTGWLGYRSTTIGTFSGSALYAPPVVNATPTQGDKVMTKATPDLGTSPTFVTYKIAVNALQPADTYTGTLVYNVTAKY